MNRKIAFLILILVMALSMVSAKAKSDPYVEDPEAEWGDVSEPASIWKPDAAAIHAGRLGADDDLDAFTVSFTEAATDWEFQLAVPVCADYFEAFFPSVAVIGPGLDVPEADSLPFDLPEDMGAVIFTEELYTQQYAEKNHRSVIPGSPINGEPAYFNTPRSVNIPEAGEYLVVLFEPNGNTGAYMLATGNGNDSFAPRPAREIDAAFDLFFGGTWMGEDCDAPITALKTSFAILSG